MDVHHPVVWIHISCIILALAKAKRIICCWKYELWKVSISLCNKGTQFLENLLKSLEILGCVSFTQGSVTWCIYEILLEMKPEALTRITLKKAFTIRHQEIYFWLCPSRQSLCNDTPSTHVWGPMTYLQLFSHFLFSPPPPNWDPPFLPPHPP
jgi:hypothetical protein